MARRAFAQRTVPPHDPHAVSAREAYPLELLLRFPPGETGEEVEGPGAAELVAELFVKQIHNLANDAQVGRRMVGSCIFGGWYTNTDKREYDQK